MESDQPQTSPPTTLSDVQANYDSLRGLVFAMLVVLVLVTGTLWVFFMRQARAAASDMALYGPQATNVIAQLKPNEPFMDDLIRKFQDFGRTNPDFMPILTKYGVPASGSTGTAPAKASAPAAPAKKK